MPMASTGRGASSIIYATQRGHRRSTTYRVLRPTTHGIPTEESPRDLLARGDRKLCFRPAGSTPAIGRSPGSGHTVTQRSRYGAQQVVDRLITNECGCLRVLPLSTVGA